MPQDSGAQRDYGLASQAQESVGGGAPTLPIFDSSFLIPLILSILSILSRDFVFLPAYPDTSGLCAPIGESTVLWGIVVRVQKCSSKKNSVSKTDG